MEVCQDSASTHSVPVFYQLSKSSLTITSPHRAKLKPRSLNFVLGLLAWIMVQQLRHRSYQKMSTSQDDTIMLPRHKKSVRVILSYVLDWIVLIVVGVVSAIIDRLEPRKRPFSLNDANISYVNFHDASY